MGWGNEDFLQQNIDENNSATPGASSDCEAIMGGVEWQICHTHDSAHWNTSTTSQKLVIIKNYIFDTVKYSKHDYYNSMYKK